MLAGQCFGCGRLVNAGNASRVTTQAGQPVYCANCEVPALAHFMTMRMDSAFGLLRSEDLTGDADQALLLLIRRLRSSFESLRALLKCGMTTAHHHDPATILRAMYEAGLQAEYIVFDEPSAQTVARQYLDFQEIERYRLIKALGKYHEVFAAKITDADMRQSNEAQIKERFEKVEAKFRKSSGSGYVNSWHEEKLRDFYKQKGLKEEYDFMLVLLHGAAHSTALAMLRGYSISPSFLMLSAAHVVWRAIGVMLEFHKIVPDPEIAALIAAARKNFLDLYKTGEPPATPPAPPATQPAAGSESGASAPVAPNL